MAQTSPSWVVPPITQPQPMAPIVVPQVPISPSPQSWVGDGAGNYFSGNGQTCLSYGAGLGYSCR